MFKQIFILIRGHMFEAEQEFADRNALPLLAQQIRDVEDAMQKTRRAVAVSIAQNQQEEDQYRVLTARIRDLETRAIAALEQDKGALAHEAAEAIALLEAECQTSQAAQAEFASEISRLQAVIRASEARIRDLKRGERLARANETAQRLNNALPDNLSTIREAEETLERLRRRQRQIDLTSAALAEMDGTADPATVIGKLAAAGCGAPLRTTGEDVLARLKNRMTNAA